MIRALLLLLFALPAWGAGFDSPLRSVAWAAMSDGARVAAVLGTIVIPAFVLCLLAAGGRRERRLGLAMVGVLALLVPLSQAGAATKYVSPTGSALWAACTTDASPCSLTTAQGSAAAGDVIYLADGEYGGLNTSTNGTSNSYIEWRATNSKRAVLNGLASGQTDKTLVIDNNYHRFVGLKVNVQTGPGSANTYGVFATGIGWEFLDGEIEFTGDAVALDDFIAYCAQIRSTGIFTGNYVHHCTYGINAFGSAAGFPALVADNVFEDFTVGDDEDSDCMSASGASYSYDFSGLIYRDNDCSGYRDDGVDFCCVSNATSRNNKIHHPSSLGDVNSNSSCIKLGYNGASGNKSQGDYCYGLTEDPSMRNYGAVMSGSSNALLESAVIANPYRCVDIAQVSGTGADNTVRHVSCPNASDAGARIYNGVTGTVLQNNVFGGAAGDIVVTTGLTATGATNRRVNGTVTGGGTYNQTGDTNGDPQFIGGPSPTTVEGFRPNCLTSPLKDAGTDVGAYQDFTGRYFTGAREIGAYACQGGTPRPTPTARPEITARPDNTARPTADARP